MHVPRFHSLTLTLLQGVSGELGMQCSCRKVRSHARQDVLKFDLECAVQASITQTHNHSTYTRLVLTLDTLNDHECQASSICAADAVCSFTAQLSGHKADAVNASSLHPRLLQVTTPAFDSLVSDLSCTGGELKACEEQELPTVAVTGHMQS